jgi:hypothetical protein
MNRPKYLTPVPEETKTVDELISSETLLFKKTDIYKEIDFEDGSNFIFIESKSL